MPPQLPNLVTILAGRGVEEFFCLQNGTIRKHPTHCNSFDTHEIIKDFFWYLWFAKEPVYSILDWTRYSCTTKQNNSSIKIRYYNIFNTEFSLSKWTSFRRSALLGTVEVSSLPWAAQNGWENFEKSQKGKSGKITSKNIKRGITIQ